MEANQIAALKDMMHKYTADHGVTTFLELVMDVMEEADASDVPGAGEASARLDDLIDSLESV